MMFDCGVLRGCCLVVGGLFTVLDLCVDTLFVLCYLMVYDVWNCNGLVFVLRGACLVVGVLGVWLYWFTVDVYLLLLVLLFDCLFVFWWGLINVCLGFHVLLLFTYNSVVCVFCFRLVGCFGCDCYLRLVWFVFVAICGTWCFGWLLVHCLYCWLCLLWVLIVVRFGWLYYGCLYVLLLIVDLFSLLTLCGYCAYC